MKLLNLILLDKEARLFDTKEFLIKTFIAVLLGSLVGRAIPYVAQDMISLLFGMLLTLEPVNRTGIRTGLKQVEATTIGALITGILLAVLGYSPWTAALSITATLYVSLLIDWRNFSVVAVFTAIYMNSFIQTDAAGRPSELRTYLLRMAALITGVLIAFFVNWLFSVFGYKHMLEKRVYHILEDLHHKMEEISQMIHKGSFEDARAIMRSFPGLFNNVDWIFATAADLEKDPLVKRAESKKVKLEKIMKMTGLVREMTHVNYDICYRVSKGDHHFKDETYIYAYDVTIEKLEGLMGNLDAIIHNKRDNPKKLLKANSWASRSLNHLEENAQQINHLLAHY